MDIPYIKSVENTWRRVIKVANHDFTLGNYEMALTSYKEALSSAEVLNCHYKDASQMGIPYMQMYAMSCNNLVCTYEKLCDFHNGIQVLKQVVHYFLHLFKEDKGKSIIIQRELTRAYLEYMNYGDRNKIETDFENLHEQIKMCNGCKYRCR